jgi:GTP pyrophosphokinase
VIALPREATPIDFAYAIHSDIGHSCVGAKVNGRIVPLRYQLKNGDVVEILTQPGHMPSKDWLAFVKTSRARNKIKHIINQQERAKAVEIGEKYLEKEARRLGVALSRVSKADWERVTAEYGVSKLEDLHAALGYGKFSARQVLHKLAPELVKEEEPPAQKETAQQQVTLQDKTSGDVVLRVKGADDLLVYRAKCCNPIRGEPIVGYVTRGKGVAVHSVNCPNVQNLMYEVERKIDVEWGRAGGDQFAVKVVVYTDDRPGMLHQLTSVFFDENANIRTLEARQDDKRGDSAVVEATVEVRDQKQFDRIVSTIRRIPGVRDIERVQ